MKDFYSYSVTMENIHLYEMGKRKYLIQNKPEQSPAYPNLVQGAIPRVWPVARSFSTKS